MDTKTTTITPPPTTTPSAIVRAVSAVGVPLADNVQYIGAHGRLLAQTLHWLHRSLILRQVRFGRPALYSQIVRVGVKSVGVITLISACIGLILALQMAPPLRELGQTDRIADLIALAIFRELGPLISAVVLVGFAGASIAAELGTMVVGEEIEALEAHGLNPVRFLVLPRVLATTLSMVVLCIIGDLVAVISGGIVGVSLLGIPAQIYFDNTVGQLKPSDFFTGLGKAAAFGLIMGLIACHNGLSVTGGAAGVGKATTNTVVHSVIAIIFADLIFTAVFYSLGWT
jgi:phospholipid/cholesterol/gamma-HCH transport system permease protein